jgi:twitching motility two-component system response regulator PilH
MPTILIADDSPSETALITKVVQDLGHSAYSVTDGEQAIEQAAKVKPDLILLDVVMPKVDGFNTCRKLKKNADTAHIPVIMVTSKNGESDQFWAERQGANGYVVKPFTPESLKTAIRQFIP